MRQTIIADISDVDRCLTTGNSQDPWFRSLGIDPDEFWDYSDKLVNEQGHSFETGYLNALIHWVRDGKLPPISNNHLYEGGRITELRPGLPDFFHLQRAEIEEDRKYNRYGITVEYYVDSTGLEVMIEGAFPGIFKDIFASRLGEINKVIAEIKQAVGYTKKTQFLHMVNKGCNVDPTIDVNVRMPKRNRRIPYSQMIFRGDGLTDVAGFAEVDDRNGFPEIVYEDTEKAYKGAQRLVADRRAKQAFPADYRKGSPLYEHSLANKRQIADAIAARQSRLTGKVVYFFNHGLNLKNLRRVA